MHYINRTSGHPFEYKEGDLASKWAVEHWQNLLLRIDPNLEFQIGVWNEAFTNAIRTHGGSAQGVGPTEEDRILRAVASHTHTVTVKLKG